MSEEQTPARDSAAIDRAWKDALAVWDVSVNLSPPAPFEGKGSSHWKGDEPLAYIDLETRQVVVNLPLLERLQARSSLTAVLAHEIGHHVRFPHSLGLAASLLLLEKKLVPGLRQSLTNLFFDLQVNEVVGRTRADELCRVYQGFVKDAGAPAPLFSFYLAVYEELWGKPAGHLVPHKAVAAMNKAYPGWRAEARVFVQTFYALPGVHLQFVYFCSRFVRYIPDPEKLAFVIALAHDVPQPDEDALDDLIIAEGWKNEGYPKIVIIREQVGEIPISPEGLLAVVSDKPVDLNVPVFGLEDVSAVASLIMTRFPRRARPEHELDV